MRIWRLLVGLGSWGVWTFVVAAPNHHQAWDLIVGELPAPLRDQASLEELESTGERRATGEARVVHSWKSAPLSNAG